MTLKYRSRVTQSDWKRNIIHDLLLVDLFDVKILSWPWNVGEITQGTIWYQSGTIWKLVYGFLFASIVTMAVSILAPPGV